MGKTRFIDLTFEGGMNEFAEASAMPEGFGVLIQNWVPEPSGGLRVPRGWVSTGTSGITGTRTARGIGYYVPAAGAQFLVAQATGSSTIRITSIPAALAAQTFTTVEDVNLSSPMSTRPVAMAIGGGVVLYATPEFPSAFIRRWDGTTASDVSADAIAGRALAYHNNRFFSGGTTANPTTLYWSELGDETTWNITTNFQPIGQDDGEPIEDLASWDRGLMIGKENSVYYLTGFGPDTFAIHTLDGGGCAPGRTLVPTPNGVVAIGRKRVWFFSGGGFEPISQAIETSYAMTGNYMSGAYLDGMVYINDEGSGTTWVWNLSTKAWSKETFDSPAEAPGIVAALDDVLLGGTRTATTNSLLLYRFMPGSPRARAANTAQTFRALTGETWAGGPTSQMTPLHMHLQIRQRAATDAPLVVNQYVDGSLERTETVDLQTSAGVYRERVDLGATGYSHQYEFLQTVTSAQSGVLDIERVQLEVQDERPR